MFSLYVPALTAYRFIKRSFTQFSHMANPKKKSKKDSVRHVFIFNFNIWMLVRILLPIKVGES